MEFIEVVWPEISNIFGTTHYSLYTCKYHGLQNILIGSCDIVHVLGSDIFTEIYTRILNDIFHTFFNLKSGKMANDDICSGKLFTRSVCCFGFKLGVHVLGSDIFTEIYTRILNDIFHTVVKNK
jgi:hypothetical protein